MLSCKNKIYDIIYHLKKTKTEFIQKNPKFTIQKCNKFHNFTNKPNNLDVNKNKYHNDKNYTKSNLLMEFLESTM